MEPQKTTQRIAKPGDIFILLVPSAQELHLLRQWQGELQARYGGVPVHHIHITSQRFTPRQGQLEDNCIEQMKIDLRDVKSFPLHTDMLIQFYAWYWNTYVLRWRVQETDEYSHFRDIMENSLLKIDCPSHFNRQRHATCTAINLDQMVNMDGNPPGRQYPTFLFTARELLVSRLVDDNDFKIIETIQLK